MSYKAMENPLEVAILENTDNFDKGGRRLSLCKCHCGKEFLALASNVKKGNTRSCGCYRKNDKVEYAPDTGKFIHPIRGELPMLASFAGGYKRVMYKGKYVLAHRLAYEIMGVKIPDGMEIDHVNGDPSDNRWCNLRIVTRSINQRNKRNSRVKGCYVRELKRINRWVVERKLYAERLQNGKPKRQSKYFRTKEEAEKYIEELSCG